MAIPDGYGRASIEWIVDGVGGPTVCTFGFIDDDGSTADDIAERIATAWTTQFDEGSMPDTWTLDKVRTQITRGVDDLAGEFVVGQVGDSAYDVECPNVCALVTKRTGIGGRRGKGRCYLPAAYLPAAQVLASGEIIDPLLSDLTTAWAAFIVALATDDLTMVLLHVDAGTPTGVIDGQCERFIATQRRRTTRG